MLAFPCNCSCSSSRAQARSPAPLSAPASDSLKQCSGGRAGRDRRRKQETLCRAVSPSTIERPPVSAVDKKDAPVKQEVVSYNGVEFEVTDKPELKSTWEHRAIVASSTLVLGLLFAQGVAHSGNGFAIAACVLAGFVFADFGSGVYHWGVDNYGSGETKLVGSQIAAFQGHHRRPWTITEREFCNNCSLTFKPAGYAGAFFCLLSLTGLTPGSWDVFAATASFFIAMSQQFHAWSHMKKSELPASVVALQDANLLISRKAHGTHHRSPFNINYCIVSGWCNPLLDSGLLMWLEQFIRQTTSVEPRGWYEPLAEWRELERGEEA